MISKLTLVAGFGAGYVLGAKAGTGRYDQIIRQVNSLMGKPAVQQVTSTVQTKAGDLADKAVDAVNSKVETLTGSDPQKKVEAALDAFKTTIERAVPQPGATTDKQT